MSSKGKSCGVSKNECARGLEIDELLEKWSGGLYKNSEKTS